MILWGQYFYALGCTIMNISYIPQIKKILKTKDVEDLALSTQLIYLVAHVFFISFGIAKKSWAATTINILSFLLILILSVSIAKYKKK
jgi:uncharacterized protein with PQ loop repeat